MDRGAWWATVQGVAKSRARLNERLTRMLLPRSVVHRSQPSDFIDVLLCETSPAFHVAVTWNEWRGLHSKIFLETEDRVWWCFSLIVLFCVPITPAHMWGLPLVWSWKEEEDPASRCGWPAHLGALCANPTPVSDALLSRACPLEMPGECSHQACGAVRLKSGQLSCKAMLCQS